MDSRPVIEPQSHQLGRVEVELSLGPIARMFPAEHWEQPENAAGGAVYGGRAGEVLLNLPREDVDKRADQFNLDAKIHDLEMRHPVPYLDVRADVVRNGAALLRDVPLVPVARPYKGVAGFHYGNNVRLERSGSYEVTVHLGPSPFIGSTADPAARFSVHFE